MKIVLLKFSLLFIFANCFFSACYSQDSMKLTLNSFSYLIKNHNCYSFTTELKNKYGVIVKGSEYLRKKTKEKCKNYPAIKINHNFIIIWLSITAEDEFYIFKKQNNKFIYIGKIPFSMRLGTPEIKLFNFNGEDIFLVNENVDGGTGLRDFNWYFYRIRKKRTLMIFSIGNNGYYDGWGGSFTREYKSRIVKFKNFLKIDYKIKYHLFGPQNNNNSSLLFIAYKTLLLEYKDKRFKLSKKSPNSYEDINKIMTHGEKYFCKHYKNKLEQIASTKDREVKKWSVKMQKICLKPRNNSDRKDIYIIQAGVFNSTKYSYGLVKKLRKIKPKLDVHYVKNAKTNYFQIYIGQYNSYKQAQEEKVKLEAIDTTLKLFIKKR